MPMKNRRASRMMAHAIPSCRFLALLCGRFGVLESRRQRSHHHDHTAAKAIAQAAPSISRSKRRRTLGASTSSSSKARRGSRLHAVSPGRRSSSRRRRSHPRDRPARQAAIRRSSRSGPVIVTAARPSFRPPLARDGGVAEVRVMLTPPRVSVVSTHHFVNHAAPSSSSTVRRRKAVSASASRAVLQGFPASAPAAAARIRR